jgi:hypothetical protein
MVNTLLLANDTAHTARAEGRAALTDTELSTIRSRYCASLILHMVASLPVRLVRA